MLPQIQLTTDLSIPSYFLWMSLLCSGLLLLAITRAKTLHYNQKITLDLALIIMVAGFVGGRLMHVLWEEPNIYLHDPFRILHFWLGGFVFYGGFAAAALMSFLYLRKAREDFFKWADFLAPLLALGYGLGRGSCLLAGCCYGSACELPWAVDFGDGLLRHPTQAYAMLWEIIVSFALFRLEKMNFLLRGQLFALWLIFHGAGRLLMESLRDDFRGSMPLGVSISSWLSIILLVLGVWLFQKFKTAK